MHTIDTQMIRASHGSQNYFFTRTLEEWIFNNFVQIMKKMKVNTNSKIFARIQTLISITRERDTGYIKYIYIYIYI